MAAHSQNCKMMEKHKYWKEFESNRHHFFKIMIGDFRNQLKIPQKFSINFRKKLSGTFHLRGPSGFMWAVVLEKKFDAVVFGDGWQSFVKDHSLADGDFVVFRYKGNSTFNVVIFDLTGCEREGSYFVKKHTNACSNGRCVLRKEDGDDSEEVVDLNRVHEKHMQKDKGKGNPSSKAVDSFQLKATKKRQPQVGKSVGASGFTEVLIDDSEESSGSEMESSEDWSTRSVSKKCKPKRKESKKERKLQGSYYVYHISNRRRITEAEKQRPRKLARHYSSPRPWFSIVMKPTHVHKAFTVNIPKQWLEVHVPDKVEKAQLSVPPSVKKWPVRIARTKWKKGFTKGWANFVLGNNLEEHDVCVFELNEKVKANEKSIDINVTIFRVLDELVPLIRFPNYHRSSASCSREMAAWLSG